MSNDLRKVWKRKEHVAHIVSKPRQVNSFLKFHHSLLHRTHKAHDCMRSKEIRKMIKPTNVCPSKVLDICLHKETFIQVHRSCSFLQLYIFEAISPLPPYHHYTYQSIIYNGQCQMGCNILTTAPTYNVVERNMCQINVDRYVK